jgi:hypothetical protein
MLTSAVNARGNMPMSSSAEYDVVDLDCSDHAFSDQRDVLVACPNSIAVYGSICTGPSHAGSVPSGRAGPPDVRSKGLSLPA